MRVRSDRTYRFAVPPAALWEACSAVEHYRRWWPWLRSFEAEALTDGAVWRCVVQPPLPYTLRFDLALEEVVPTRFVRAGVTGDIAGSATLEIDAVDGGCSVRLRSDLAPRNDLLRIAAAVAGPIVRFGHDWVLDTGVRQFRQRALAG